MNAEQFRIYRGPQEVVNAQVDINRAVFEQNRRGLLKTDPYYQEKPRDDYMLACINSAIESLEIARQFYSRQIEIPFTDELPFGDEEE